ncbi:hypothetical protein SERLADRAFT_435831 [Serpula lacrymans var. lacrymans S7.9]|uniref:Uncharacterized protein n=1 Tax=Serpula lacrymans var. lacrymans (strain S7.9) TaxID=578457 RepID=F8NNK2_SERL9|nr:uncharacterized protein SERLADRAFT_435831 [Serpula lacrymans var. lacrymans S7.9]EGO28059.1 hypothetical protein SERLADRAFT_435831 [Serpula lacrymans var. lacrymans S7.9]
MTTARDTSACPVLTGPNNFQIWKLRIISKLRREKVLQVVTGEEFNSSPCHYYYVIRHHSITGEGGYHNIMGSAPVYSDSGPSGHATNQYAFQHIQRKYHFIQDDLVSKGEAVIRYVPTGDMVADILTKPLTHEKHWKFSKAMGLRLHLSGSDKTG